MKTVAAAALALALLGCVTGCGHTVAVQGTAKTSIDVAGRERTFAYHLPDDYTAAKQWPLVISLHGRGGNGVQLERSSGMSGLASREGFIVVYPDGFDHSWHDLREYGPAAENHVDDVAYIRALIDRFIRERNVDPSRVYVDGISNGGMMSFRLACELSDKIAAVGVVIGLMPENGMAECKPTHPMPLAMFVGTEDPLVPYNGGMVARNNGRVLSAQATFDWWSAADGCDNALDVNETIDRADDSTRVIKTGRSQCQAGSEVLLYSIEGGGHTWPNGDQYLPKAFIGRVSHEVDGSAELWSFFKRHKLPASSP